MWLAALVLSEPQNGTNSGCWVALMFTVPDAAVSGLTRCAAIRSALIENSVIS